MFDRVSYLGRTSSTMLWGGNIASASGESGPGQTRRPKRRSPAFRPSPRATGILGAGNGTRTRDPLLGKARADFPLPRPLSESSDALSPAVSDGRRRGFRRSRVRIPPPRPWTNPDGHPRVQPLPARGARYLLPIRTHASCVSNKTCSIWSTMDGSAEFISGDNPSRIQNGSLTLIASTSIVGRGMPSLSPRARTSGSPA
jgi:hypothetical protein